jgi:hypothetical protein
MRKQLKITSLVAVVMVMALFGCRSTGIRESAGRKPLKYDTVKSKQDSLISETGSIRKNPAVVKIYGDTVRVRSYASIVWYDSVRLGHITVYCSSWVDTTDYIVDTVISTKGNRIVIGYNHYYNLFFRKDGNFLFSVNFNKKDDLKNILQETDFWLESNIDVFRNIFYNETFDKYVIDYHVNPRYSYGAVYYIVINSTGGIDYIGEAGTWGGGDPDGTPFMTGNDKLFVTASELYDFANQCSVDVSDFPFRQHSARRNGYHDLTDLHAYKPLTDSTVLLIFNRSDITPEYNAFVINSDTTILEEFKYYGIMEEMEAVLFFEYNDSLNAYFLYDTDRKTLIRLPDSGDFHISEYSIKDMRSIDSDTMPDQDDLSRISFETVGTYTFFIGSNDSNIYYEIENF